MDVRAVENMLEGRRETAGEQSADEVHVVCKEWIVVMTRHSLLLFVDKTKSSNEESEYPFQYSNNEWYSEYR